MLDQTGLHLESEQYLRWGILTDICLTIYNIITDIYKYFRLLLRYGTFKFSQAQA